MSDMSSADGTEARRPRRPLSRPARVALIGGLAAGTAFAAVTGVASASSSRAKSRGPAGGRVAPAAPGPGLPGPGAPAGSGPGGAPAGRGPGGGPPGVGGPGGGGTITAVSGSTLELRTMNGTETVHTSASTTYSKEMATTRFSDLAVGDVVQVTGVPASASAGSSSRGSSSAPPPPGTGAVDATAVMVVEPSFTGRVTSDSNGTLRLVGPDGQLLSVSTTGATRYYRGTSRTEASAISDGDHVVAEGAQTSLTHLTADVVALAPTPPAPGRATRPSKAPRSSPSSASSGASQGGS
jgi:hypothetical protein